MIILSTLAPHNDINAKYWTNVAPANEMRYCFMYHTKALHGTATLPGFICSAWMQIHVHISSYIQALYG